MNTASPWQFGSWALALSLSACPGPQGSDAGTSGGTGGITGFGSCDANGRCPGTEYCEPFVTQCSGQVGLGVQLQPGNCYANVPCPTDGGGSNGEDCQGMTCTSNFDCGQAFGTDPTVGLTCQMGFCTLPGGSNGSSAGGGTQVPICSPLWPPWAANVDAGIQTAVCPAGCSPLTPLYGCPVCLCATCPVDAGVVDAGPGDAG